MILVFLINIKDIKNYQFFVSCSCCNITTTTTTTTTTKKGQNQNIFANIQRYRILKEIQDERPNKYIQ